MPPGRPQLHRAISLAVTRFAPRDGIDQWPELEYLAECRDIRQALTQLEYQVDGHDDLPAADLGSAVQTSLRAATGPLIVHLLTHGETGADGRTLYAIGADGLHHQSTDVESWLKMVRDFSGRSPTLFLLDLCHSGLAAEASWSATDSDNEPHAWVIAATGPGTAAFDGRFTKAAAKVLSDLENHVDPHPRERFVRMNLLTEAIRAEVKAMGGQYQRVTGTRFDGDPHLPFFKNPRYDAARSSRDRVDPATLPFLDEVFDAAHWSDRLSGRPDRASEYGCFAGRREQARDLATWLDAMSEGPNLRVVTGSPGAGKSALLSLLVCAAHPQLHDQTRQLWQQVPDPPSVNHDLLVLHARQRTRQELIDSIGRQLDTRDRDLAIEDIAAAIRTREVATTIVVDAFDEAMQPVDLVDGLLRPLLAVPTVRLLVGTRASELAKPLLDAAREAGGLTDLDEVGNAELEADLGDYVDGLLRAAEAYQDNKAASLRNRFAVAVARTLVSDRVPGPAGRRWGEFLVAGLYTHYVVSNGTLSDVAEAERVGDLVPRTLPEVFELDLAVAASPWRRAVLAAIARSRGQGIPFSVLRRLAALWHPDRPRLTPPEQVRQALEADRFYLSQSPEADGSTLYRLFHEGLAEHLRERPLRPQPEPTCNDETLLSRLLEPLGQDGARDWSRAEPYVLRHAFDHAELSGRGRELLTDAGFLLHADPVHLLASLDQLDRSMQEFEGTLDPAARLASAVYRTSPHQGLAMRERQEVLAVDAARWHADALLQDLRPGREALSVEWASGAGVSAAHRTAFVHDAVALTCLLDGDRPRLITAGMDGVLRSWDSAAGAGSPIVPSVSNVRSLAAATVGSRGLLATGNEDGAVGLWDLESGQPLDLPIQRHSAAVCDIGWLTWAGREIVVTGGFDGVIHSWNPETGKQAFRSLSARSLVALDCVDLDGRPIVVFTDGAALHMRDLGSDKPVGQPIARGHGRITALACVVIGAAPVAVVGYESGATRVWDLIDGAEISAELSGHDGPVSAVACAHTGDGPIVASSSRDGSVRTSRLISPSSAIRRQKGSAHPVRVVRFDDPDQNRALVACDSGGWVRSWAIEGGTPLDHFRTVHAGEITSADLIDVDGRTLIVTGGEDGRIERWDLQSHAPVGDPITGHQGAVRALACAYDSEGRVIAASTGDDGTVRFWDVAGGTPLGPPLDDGHRGSATAVAFAHPPMGLVAVTGGGTDRSVMVWDVARSQRLHRRPMRLHRGGVTSIACVTVGERHLAVTGSEDHRVRLWDLLEGKACDSPKLAHDGPVRAVACMELPHGAVALSGADDGTVRLWDLSTPRLVSTTRLPARPASLAVDPAGRVAVSFGLDVAVYRISQEGLELR